MVCHGIQMFSIWSLILLTATSCVYADFVPPNVLYGLHLGCFKDQKSPRILPEKVMQLDINTPDTCTRACHGYAYAGVENSVMCYCGNTLPTVTSDQCNKNCITDSNYKCGGFLAINLYNVTTPRKVVCYTMASATARSDGFTLTNSVDAHLCTHFILSLNSGLDGLTQLRSLKAKNPQAKLMIAFGGGETSSSTAYSQGIADQFNLAAFGDYIYDTIISNSLDGCDIDWYYPTENGGIPEDKQNLVLFLTYLRAKFDSNNSQQFTLSVSVASAAAQITNDYDIANIMPLVDFINVLTFNYHRFTTAPGVTGQNAPLFASATQDLTLAQQQLNVDKSIQFWLSQGASSSKINLGIATFGSSYTLAVGAVNALGSPTLAAGSPGPITNNAGIMGYNEICSAQRSSTWTVTYDTQQQVPYTFTANQWIGYDNVRSIQRKAQYVVDNDLGGVTISMIEMDDFNNRCASGGNYPLIRAANAILYPLQ